MYKIFFKRLFDFIAAIIGLLLLSPIIIITTIFLFISNNGHPFFFQSRPGKNEIIFKIIKFKTMNDKKDKNGELLPFEQRITKVGSFIRKFSLDEIPQLINVLKGDMSLIGPRPLLVQYLPLYNENQKRRHEVKPGVTGWAQVNGCRGETDTVDKMRERVQYDLEYIENWRLSWDLEIIFKTAFKAWSDKSAY